MDAKSNNPYTGGEAQSYYNTSESQSQYPPASESQYPAAPPQYTQYADPAGNTVVVDTNTGYAQNGSSAPPTDAAAIKSIYSGVSGINLLTEADTIIILDDSESMGIFGYWPIVEQMLSYLGPVVATYDPNGVSMYCLNARGPSSDDAAHGIAGQGWNDLKTGEDIQKIFRSTVPMGTTPISDKLEHVLIPYLSRLVQDPSSRPRPINVLVLTDGVADDEEGVEELVVEVCSMLDRANAPTNQLGIQFVQVADLEVATRHIRANAKPHEVEALIAKAANDAEASTGWLESLDDYAKNPANKVTRDIIDTKNSMEVRSTGGYNPKNLVKILVGALSKRHDRMK